MKVVSLPAPMLAWGLERAIAGPIDRHALVARHNVEWNEVRGQIPLGNGEFCFSADATGLQTFGGSTLSRWGWRPVAARQHTSGCSAHQHDGVGLDQRSDGQVSRTGGTEQLDVSEPASDESWAAALIRTAGVELNPNDT